MEALLLKNIERSFLKDADEARSGVLDGNGVGEREVMDDQDRSDKTFPFFQHAEVIFSAEEKSKSLNTF